jgi:hypothetical protein
MPGCAAEGSGPARLGLRLTGALVGVIVLGSAPALAAPKTRAAEAVTTAVPLPPPRPAEAGEPIEAPQGSQPVTSETPTPPPRPTDLADPAPVAAAPAKPEVVAEESACQERLVKLGVRFEPLPAIANGLCGAPHPLRVSHLPDGLEVSPPATLVCAVAEALSRWTKEVVATEAGRHLEAQPTRIAIGTSYECRNQNRQTTGKLSEHAFANAVDISAFEFKGRKALQIRDHPAETPEALFQAAIRTQACPYFTTVLGPGSDAAHATHLHFDLRGRNRGFRMCQ